ncbi:MAG TPA: ECF-type sigma factor [Bryobacteraceae bacterium]|nr:ECF-type sigma factor [Bryobacteraceae bacterium]
MLDEAGDITQLLRAWGEGSPSAENQLFELVHGDLRRLAHFRIKGERKGGPLQTTELVDQIYIRLVSAKNRDWQSRQHFFAIAGRAMRRYLIDLARRRPDAELVRLTNLEQLIPGPSAKVDLGITVGKLLDELEETNAQWCTVVELKFFLGLNDEEAAHVLGVTLRTMQRMWHDARRWLFSRMEPDHGEQVPK